MGVDLFDPRSSVCTTLVFWYIQGLVVLESYCRFTAVLLSVRVILRGAFKILNNASYRPILLYLSPPHAGAHDLWSPNVPFDSICTPYHAVIPSFVSMPILYAFLENC